MNKTIITTSDLVERLDSAAKNIQSVTQEIQININKVLSDPELSAENKALLSKAAYDVSGFKYNQLTEKPDYDIAVLGNIYYLQELEYQLVGGSDIITDKEYIQITEDNVSADQYAELPLNKLYSATNIFLDNNLASSTQTIINTIANIQTYNVAVWEYDSVNGDDLHNKYNDETKIDVLPKSPNPQNLEVGQIWISKNVGESLQVPEVTSTNMSCKVINPNPFDVLCEMTNCCYETEEDAKLALRHGEDTFNGVVKAGSYVNTDNYEYSGKYVACRFKYNSAWSGISCCLIK